MTPEQIKLVQQSFAHVAPDAEEASQVFYTRLFEQAPEVRPLFKGDMRDQGKKLMAMLATVVQGLNDLDALMPAIRALAVRQTTTRLSPRITTMWVPHFCGHSNRLSVTRLLPKRAMPGPRPMGYWREP